MIHRHYWFCSESAGRRYSDIGEPSIDKLVAAMDEYIPQPNVMLIKPF